ncbi:alpha/beta fold hydrolase [Herbiconiux moechotypicola]|uniref:AB hydrolase-1 domain-containing protein n=1 Tax=Herbiconiux moechotypicola TaxID=637393 RepID=A0ABN3DDY1_9MICO|nr:alpha/beta fold hydrolase [Herbiconiux moechotypicola]MCS5729236.1 alpha/beta fold hydrolase [Herbiconiux moechotypicola]
MGEAGDGGGETGALDSGDVDEAPIDLTVERVELDGACTRVTIVSVEGVQSERSFVLVAGVGVAATYFEFLAPALARHGTVYALDLPGFAGMPRPRGNEQPTAAFFARQVSHVLDRYELENPVLLGHSMGTQVVTEVLAAHPELAHAVLVSPVVNDAERAAPVQAVRFAQAGVHESVHLVLTALSAYILCGVAYFLTVLPHLLSYPIVARIGGVRASVLFIRGEFDRTSPRRFHSRLVAAVGAERSRRWEIEEAAHSIINGHALGVAELTLGHVRGTLARRGRMPSAEAAVPPARHADLALVLRALGSRAAEWGAALRGDDAAVGRAKREHAKLLWHAYTRRR